MLKAVYLQTNLQKTAKDGNYVINFDEYKSIRTQWIALYVSANGVTCFDSFSVELIPQEIKRFIANMITNIFRKQVLNSIIY